MYLIVKQVFMLVGLVYIIITQSVCVLVCLATQLGVCAPTRIIIQFNKICKLLCQRVLCNQLSNNHCYYCMRCVGHT